MNDEDILLQAFPGKNPDSPHSMYDEIGDVFDALAFRMLFWPECFVLRGAVFLGVGANSAAYVQEGLESILSRPPENRPTWTETVDRFNWFEVPYLFGLWRGPAELADEASFTLANSLSEMWSARLAQLFPERRFSVSMVEPTSTEALSVSVRQVSPVLREPDRDE